MARGTTMRLEGFARFHDELRDSPRRRAADLRACARVVLQEAKQLERRLESVTDPAIRLYRETRAKKLRARVAALRAEAAALLNPTPSPSEST